MPSGYREDVSDTGENQDQDTAPLEPDPAPGEAGENADAPVDGDDADEQSAESFPSSDPPASYAGPDVPQD